MRKRVGFFQDSESQESCEVLFRILCRTLGIPVSRIFQGEMRSCSEFLQVPDQIFFQLGIQNPIKNPLKIMREDFPTILSGSR